MKAQKTKEDIREKRKTKRLFFIMIISGLLCAALGVGVLVYFFVPRDNDTYILTIPAFIGLNENTIGSHSGVVIEREWIYSSEIARGRVISQTPYAGARRKVRRGADCTVKVYISLGEQSESLPDLCGVELMSAASAIRALGARVRSVAVYGDGEDGKVLSVSPLTGTRIKAGDTVTLFVSRKKTDSPIIVPDFCGMELAEAYRLALSKGLYIAEGDTIFLGARVTEQSIPSGAYVKKGSYISFRTEEEKRDLPPIVWRD